jgi:hemolysin III
MESYTRHQEIVNGIIHGIGILFGVSCLPLLLVTGAVHDNTAGIVGAAIYSFCYLFLFTASTVFHLAVEPAIRNLFKILDHISIYFLIAGTYTPFLLVFLPNTFGISLLCILWTLTFVGVYFKIRFTGRYEIVSTVIYLLMGWIMVVGGRQFFDAMPTNVLVFIFIGCGLYSIGVIFYLWDKHLYTHAVWHGFVLAAAICHYIAVLLTQFTV